MKKDPSKPVLQVTMPVVPLTIEEEVIRLFQYGLAHCHTIGQSLRDSITDWIEDRIADLNGTERPIRPDEPTHGDRDFNDPIGEED